MQPFISFQPPRRLPLIASLFGLTLVGCAFGPGLKDYEEEIVAGLTLERTSASSAFVYDTEQQAILVDSLVTGFFTTDNYLFIRQHRSNLNNYYIFDLKINSLRGPLSSLEFSIETEKLGIDLTPWKVPRLINLPAQHKF